MKCYKINDCAFFALYKSKLGDQRLQTIINSYCEGPFQPLCKRLIYMAMRDETPPLDLCPDGYQFGTGKKIYP